MDDRGEDRVYDIPTAARALRDEAVVALAAIECAERAAKGRHLPASLRRAIGLAKHAAEVASRHARRLDDMIAVVTRPGAGEA